MEIALDRLVGIKPGWVPYQAPSSLLVLPSAGAVLINLCNFRVSAEENLKDDKLDCFCVASCRWRFGLDGIQMNFYSDCY